MRQTVEDDLTLKRYLLDDIAPEERRRLEERLLDDQDDFIDQLQIAEAELADDYVAGALSEAERARFAEVFLSTPERREQLRYAETLRDYLSAIEPLKKTVTDKPALRPSWLQRFSLLLGLDRPAAGFALTCGLILALGVAVWLGLRARSLRLQLDSLQTRQTSAPDNPEERARLQQQLAEERTRRESAAQELSREQGLRANLEQELARLRAGGTGEIAEARPAPERIDKPTPPTKPRGPVARVLAITLTSGAVRELGETKELRLKPTTTTVRLRLDIGADDFKHYRAALETAEGEQLLSKDTLRPRTRRGSRRVVLDVPARLLEAGDFQLRLSGVTDANVAENVGSYYFRVRRD